MGKAHEWFSCYFSRDTLSIAEQIQSKQIEYLAGGVMFKPLIVEDSGALFLLAPLFTDVFLLSYPY